jgi:peptide/nickel transport system permease protein
MTLPGTYVLRRLLIALPSLLGISVVLFTVLALAPGDPFGDIVSNPNIPADVAANLRLVFDDDHRALPALADAMLQGDWASFASRIDVDTLILQRLPVTLLVIGVSQILALLIALPVGIYAATRPYSLFDQIANTLTFIGFAYVFTGLPDPGFPSSSTGCLSSTAPISPRPAGAGGGSMASRR